MRQTLHLLVLDDGCRSAIAEWHGTRWMLPVLDVPERVRAPLIVLQWLAARRLQGEVVGQWLGRAQRTNTAMDWLVVVRAQRRPSEVLPKGSRWASLSTLLSSPALLAYQRWVLSEMAPGGEAPMPRGPFATTTWPNEVRTWVRDVFGSSGDISIVPHRVSAYELVLQCDTNHGRYFLKGLSSERAVEATLTMRLYQLAPQAFARTVARATRLDGSVWWLMEACPGHALKKNMTARSSGGVAAACARVQESLGADETIRSVLQPLDLCELERWTRDLLVAEGELSMLDRCVLSMREACGCIEGTGVAWSWVSVDMDPSNTIVHGSEVRFIDLDDSVIGPAPLAVATFARRIRRIAPECAEPLHHAYETAWHPSLAIGERWSSVDRMSRILECYLGWQRVRLKSERGEITGFIDHARKILATKVIKACEGSAVAR